MEDTKPQGVEHYDIADTEDELEALKRQADLLGITYSATIGVDTLRKRVASALSKDGSETTASEGLAVVAEPAESLDAFRRRMQQDAAKLIRVRISCHDPMKKEYTGEVFTVLNGVVGVYKRFVQFNEPWHVPQIILSQLEDKMYQQFHEVKDDRGNKHRKSKLTRAYSIERLPPLTEAEIKELAADQLARRAVG